MKSCPICDKQVNGNWCKNCKCFVKPKEYTRSFTINESANTRTASSATNSTSGSYDAYPVFEKNVVVSANKKNGGKDPIKRYRAIAVATALVALGLAAIISRLQQLENHREKYENFTLPSIDMSSFSSLGEEFSKLASYAVVPYKEGDDPQRWSDMITKLGYPQLAECFPTEINEYSDEVQYKLNPERLSGLDIECDTYYHFDCYFKDLHVMFGPLMVYELIEDVDASASNYVLLAPTTGDKMVVWQSELDFISENGTIMEAYYDTCSKRVHYIEMQSYDNWDEMGLLADTFLNNVDKPYWTTGEDLAAFLAQEANLLIGTALDDPDVLYNCKVLSSGVIEAAPNVDMTMELYYFEPYDTEGARPYFNLRLEPKIKN